MNNNPDLNEILSKEIGDLVDLLHTGFKEIAEVYELNTDQISEMEKDFIARLAFSAIKYGVNKEEEKSEKEPEKKTFPDDVWKALRFIKNNCDHECKNCPFGSGSGLICDLNNLPSYWEV